MFLDLLVIKSATWPISRSLDLLKLRLLGYGKYRALKVSRWARTGVFESLFNAMSDDPDLEYALIDGTIVQAHQKASGAKGGLRLRPSDARAAD